jgi:hypothetical protein
MPLWRLSSKVLFHLKENLQTAWAPPLPGEARSSLFGKRSDNCRNAKLFQLPAGRTGSLIGASSIVLADATTHSQFGPTRLDNGILRVEGVSFRTGPLQRLHPPRSDHPHMSRVATCRANAPARAEVVNQPPANRNLSHKRLIVDARSFDFPAAYEHPAEASVILGSSEFPAARFALHCNFATQPLSEIFAHKRPILVVSYMTRTIPVISLYDLCTVCKSGVRCGVRCRSTPMQECATQCDKTMSSKLRTYNLLRNFVRVGAKCCE